MRVFLGNLIVLSLLFVRLPAGQAADEPKDVKVGDAAPSFDSTDDQGKPWKSADHVGKKIVVVYFYPADMTGGCTKQACAFRDDSAKLTDKGIEVVGVSGDSPANHQLFKSVHKLNFTLLADEKGDVAKAFGVPVGKGGTFIYKGDDGKVSELVRGVSISRWTVVMTTRAAGSTLLEVRSWTL